MSSIAIISDIHGNLPALDAVLHDIAVKKVDAIYCLGDLVGYYCYFNEVVEKIIDLNIPSIMGNHDYALAYNNGIIERSKTCTKILGWQLENTHQKTISYIKSLPKEMTIKFGNKAVFFVHGGLLDPTDEYLFDVKEDYFTENNFSHDILITGHTHLISYKKFYNGKTWLNPGSVGQPRDFDNRASYLLLNDSFDVQFVRVEYDYNKVLKEMQQLGFDNYISDTLTNGKKIGFSNI
jgi:putative phosphoesterase